MVKFILSFQRTFAFSRIINLFNMHSLYLYEFNIPNLCIKFDSIEPPFLTSSNILQVLVIGTVERSGVSNILSSWQVREGPLMHVPSSIIIKTFGKKPRAHSLHPFEPLRFQFFNSSMKNKDLKSFNIL